MDQHYCWLWPSNCHMEMVVKGAAAAEGAVAKMKPGMTVICQRKGTEELFLATEHVVMWRVSEYQCHCVCQDKYQHGSDLRFSLNQLILEEHFK